MESLKGRAAASWFFLHRFACVTIPIYMCAMTHSYVWHYSFTNSKFWLWPYQMTTCECKIKGLIHSSVRHDYCMIFMCRSIHISPFIAFTRRPLIWRMRKHRWFESTCNHTMESLKGRTAASWHFLHRFAYIYTWNSRISPQMSKTTLVLDSSRNFRSWWY